MATGPATDKDRRLAQRCVNCPMCQRARHNQRGFAFWFVTRVESRICPFSKAYERVHGRKPHEPPSGEDL